MMIARQSQELQDSVLVSLAVAAESLGVSVKTLRRRISDGTVRGYRVGRLIRVDLDEVRNALVVEIPTAR
ncbi:excisionase family DNA-binding protein [Gulosibacter chungangensis]|uniref:DNA-binding protein n=1 Tax=Gulosibacter chungangensis TaxID=979746 RepID=A0A7J5BAS7_9MICO|nr:excisionase family DNA-binding protein [Gulosibacter chungangensis]KAB1643171.1 DNA-binding protein [Gulosibacter chungangensis]